MAGVDVSKTKHDVCIGALEGVSGSGSGSGMQETGFRATLVIVNQDIKALVLY